jgi:hypothetical protein
VTTREEKTRGGAEEERVSKGEGRKVLFDCADFVLERQRKPKKPMRTRNTDINEGNNTEKRRRECEGSISKRTNQKEELKSQGKPGNQGNSVC